MLESHSAQTLIRLRKPKRKKCALMSREDDTKLMILVVEDVHETRDGIEKLLTADGYRVAAVRDEREARGREGGVRPALSLARFPSELMVPARRIRDSAGLRESVPVVVFCIEGIGQGEEVAIGRNVY